MTVMIVLMTSYQVSEKWNVGPVSTQTKMTSTAQAKAHALPRTNEDWRAKMRKAYSITAKKFRWAMCLRSFLILVSTAIYLIS